MTIFLIVFNLVFIFTLLYLFFGKKFDNFYLIIAFFSLIAIDLSLLSIYLAFSIPILILILLPFASKTTITTTKISHTHEEIDYYNDFKDFISNYLELMQNKFPFSSIVIYEDKGGYHKLLKLYPFKEFKHSSYIIENNSAIFTALKHSSDEKFTIKSSNKIIFNEIETHHDSDLDVLLYLYDGYLVFILYEENIDNKLIKSLNSFLALFKNLRKQLALKEYNEKLLSLSKNLNKVISLDDTLENFINSIDEYIGFNTAIITFYENDVHVIKKVYSDNELILSLKGEVINDNNSLIDLSFKTAQPLPSNFRYDHTKNHLLETDFFNNYKSIIVYPIKENGDVIGNLTLLSENEYHYEKKIIKNLELMFNMFEVALLNAKIFKKVEEMATIDGLTGLVNHRTFQEKLDEYLERANRYKTKVAVILTDIDHFKAVNDNYGHPMGDEVLRQISSILKNSVRNVDLVARYGGEEFVIILEESSRENTETLANKIREDIKALEFTSKGTKFNVTISMGFSLFSESSRDKKELISLADQALYYSKDNGRDKVTFINDINS